jgi:dipeptidyl-peptidase-4
MKSLHWVRSLVFLVSATCISATCISGTAVAFQETTRQETARQETVAQEGVAEAKSESPKLAELSVETLFHPKDRVEYFGKMPPSTRWLMDSTLAVRKGEAWQILDPDSQVTSDWDWPAKARQELGKLTGFSSRALDAAARSLVGEAENFEEPMLVRIGGAIAVVGAGREPRLVTRDARGWQSASLSPDGAAIAFVRDNDLYVVKVESGEIIRLTQDGRESLLNGRLDWTYQEEIYGRGNFKGFWWSPDSQHLAFLKIDIADVLPFTLTESRTPRGGTLVAKYPKAGDPIPKASLWIADTESLQLTAIHKPEGDEAEALVVRVTWRPDGRRLTYQIQNRIQTWLELRESDISAATPRVLLHEEGPAWIEILGEPHWLPSGEFLWLSDLPAGRRHLWKVAEDGTRRIPITSGEWDVRDIVRLIPEDKQVFVTGDRDRGVSGQQLYRIVWDSQNVIDDSIESLTTTPGWHSADVSPDGKWFTDSFSTLTTEPVKTLVKIDGGSSQAIGENDPSASPWRSLKLSQPEWLDITTKDGTPLPAFLIPPTGMEDGTSDKRYPVLIYTYGGPLAPSAVDRWSGRNYLFHQLMAAQGIGVLVVDNRSSGGRGIADTWSVHRRLGVQELADLLEAVDFLKTIPWVDGDRLAIRGWSFGGYYTAYALTHSTAFAAGVAGGSVTDWRNYDAFYTERYMDTPQNNEAGYRDTSVIEKAADLHGRLLLIHGEVDDNVHPGNTLQLSAALQRAGKPFDLMIYPDAAHGVGEPNQVYHMHRMMMDFLIRELKPKQ